MLDALSLDQLRMFVTAAERGSFSDAARQLSRAQSAVSEAIMGVEVQLGVKLFDRSGRYPALTEVGAVLLADARAVLAGVDSLKTRAKSIASGIEPELAVVVDVFYPMDAITKTASEFRQKFPATPLHLYVDAMGGVFQMLEDSGATLGISGVLPLLPAGMALEPMMDVKLVMVAAASHPLAVIGRQVSRDEAAHHTQVVLTDRSRFSAGRDFGVVSPSTWRVSDLYAKRAFIMSGLGWGGMPFHVVEADLAARRLICIQIEGVPPEGVSLPISAVYPRSKLPGPAGRWLIDRLRVHGLRALDSSSVWSRARKSKIPLGQRTDLPP